MKKRCLVMIYEDCALYEIATALELLKDICTLNIAAPNKNDIIEGIGLKVHSDLSYDEAFEETYDCVIVPGGNIYNILDNDNANKIIQKCNANKGIIGAICSAPLLLAQSKILVGKNFTHAAIYPESKSNIWDQATFLKELCVVDDNIVTANPHGHISFAIALAKKMGYFKNEEMERMCKTTFNEAIEFDWDMIKPVPDDEWNKMREE